MTLAWAQRREAMLSDCIVSPDVFTHMVDHLRDFVRPYQPMVLVSYKPCNIYRTLQTNRVSFLGLQSSDDSSTLGGVTSLRGEESRMMTVEFITALFYEVDEQLGTIPKHPEAHLWPSEVVTLGLLHALKGVGNRPSR